MKLIYRFVALASLGLLALSCGSIPEVRYYMVDLSSPESEPPGDHKGLPVTLGISPFQASPLYEDDRIVYRQNPYEVKFYHYRRWVVTPSQLVSEEVYQHFLASGLFADVVRYTGAPGVDYVLAGEVFAFEEWDEKDVWYAQVGLRARLISQRTGEVVWQEKFFRRKPAQAKDPVRVVEAMSQALKEVVSELLNQTQAAITQMASAETSASP